MIVGDPHFLQPEAHFAFLCGVAQCQSLRSYHSVVSKASLLDTMTHNTQQSQNNSPPPPPAPLTLTRPTELTVRKVPNIQTSQLGGGSAIAEGLPAFLVLPELLHAAHVESPVPLGHVEDQQVEDLALLHHGQLQLGPREALGVVAVEARLPHVDAGDEHLVFGALGDGRQEGPLDHRHGGVPTPLGHHAGQRHVLALLGHGEGGGRDGDVNGVTYIWKEDGVFNKGQADIVDFRLVPIGWRWRFNREMLQVQNPDQHAAVYAVLNCTVPERNFETYFVHMISTTDQTKHNLV